MGPQDRSFGFDHPELVNKLVSGKPFENELQI